MVELTASPWTPLRRDKICEPEYAYHAMLPVFATGIAPLAVYEIHPVTQCVAGMRAVFEYWYNSEFCCAAEPDLADAAFQAAEFMALRLYGESFVKRATDQLIAELSGKYPAGGCPLPEAGQPGGPLFPPVPVPPAPGAPPAPPGFAAEGVLVPGITAEHMGITRGPFGQPGNPNGLGVEPRVSGIYMKFFTHSDSPKPCTHKSVTIWIPDRELPPGHTGFAWQLADGRMVDEEGQIADNVSYSDEPPFEMWARRIWPPQRSATGQPKRSRRKRGGPVRRAS